MKALAEMGGAVMTTSGVASKSHKRISEVTRIEGRWQWGSKGGRGGGSSVKHYPIYACTRDNINMPSAQEITSTCLQ